MYRRHEPSVTYMFVIACVLVYFGSLALPVQVFMDVAVRYSVLPIRFTSNPNFLSLFTYMFLHVNLQHLLSNCFVLLGIGRAVESEIGGRKFGAGLVISGIVSGYLHIINNPFSETPLVGASGAVFGAIAMLLFLMPFKWTNALLIPLPGVVLGLGMLALEVASILYTRGVSVAHDVHLFGFIIGGLSSFGIDYSRAFRGLLVSILTLAALYYVLIYMGVSGI